MNRMTERWNRATASSAALLMVLLSAGLVLAEGAPARKRGLVITAACPYSCKMAGVPASSCREWDAGETCYVEDLSQPPGHRNLILLPEGMRLPASSAAPSHGRMRRDGQGTWISVSAADLAPPRAGSGSAPPAAGGKRGLVTSSPCPFSCRSAGLRTADCREWTDGDRCYVEDLNQAPGHRSLLPVPSAR